MTHPDIASLVTPFYFIERGMIPHAQGASPSLRSREG